MAYSAIPHVPKSVLRLVLPSENPYVTGVNQMIDHLNSLGSRLPENYGWRYRTSDGFRQEMEHLKEGATDALPFNNLYWRDQLGNWEAYSVMNSWRTIDLARSCIWALNRQDTLCASLLGRSALETAAQFVDACRTVNATICGPADGTNPCPVIVPDFNLRTNLINSKELEQISVKIIFASRQSDAEEIYKPTNIVTVIHRIAKIQEQGFILKTYETLCEVAHPNMLGRLLYLKDFEPGPWAGNELRTLGPGNGIVTNQLLEAAVAALSWACGVQVSASQLLAGTIGNVIKRLDAAATIH